MGNNKGKQDARGTTDSGSPTSQDHEFSIGMAPLEFTREQILESESAITQFASLHINKNKLAGLEFDRCDVITMWWLNARKVFSRGDPKREEIIAQASESVNLYEDLN